MVLTKIKEPPIKMSNSTPRGVIMTSLYNADNTFLTRDLADYLALFLVIVLGLFRLDAVIKRLQIGIRMTRDIGCETDIDADELQDTLDEHEASEIVTSSFEDHEIYERQFRDFACNTRHIQLNDQESNTELERIDLPALLTDFPVNRYTSSGTNTDHPGLHFIRKTLISECTQTSRTSLIKGKTTSTTKKPRSRIPVLLKKTDRKQRAHTLSSMSSTSSSLSIPELFSGTASFYPSPRSSPSGWSHRTTPSPTRTVTPEAQELSRLLPKSYGYTKSDALKKSTSSTWSERYRYCDSSIRNDILLRSPRKKDSSILEYQDQARWSVGENNHMDNSRVGRSNCVRKCRSFGGEVTEYSENLSPQNFVFKPRQRYLSNRRLFKVTYEAGS